VQIHGSYGYMTEYEVERDFRDAVGARLHSGTLGASAEPDRGGAGSMSNTGLPDLLADSATRDGAHPGSKAATGS
jgi:hypothetical protein